MYAFSELRSKFNRRTTNKIEYKLENNTYVYWRNYTHENNQPYYEIILHGSIIATITEDKITLDNNDYYTMTTKDRLNKVLADNKIPFRIYQSHFDWYLYPVNNAYGNVNENYRIPFYNGISFVYETSPLMGIGWRISTD